MLHGCCSTPLKQAGEGLGGTCRCRRCVYCPERPPPCCGAVNVRQEQKASGRWPALPAPQRARFRLLPLCSCIVDVQPSAAVLPQVTLYCGNESEGTRRVDASLFHSLPKRCLTSAGGRAGGWVGGWVGGLAGGLAGEQGGCFVLCLYV